MKGIPKDILERLQFKKLKYEEACPPRLVGIEHLPKPCEDCSLTVTDRRIEYRQRVNPHLHWAQTCVNCNLIKHPETGEFTIKPSEYIAIYKALIDERDK